MRTSRALVVASSLQLVIGILLLGGSGSATAEDAAGPAPDQRVIVLLEAPGALASGDAEEAATARGAAAGRRMLLTQQRDVVDAARDRGADVEVDHRWTGLVNGFSAAVQPSEVEALRETPGVRAVVPDRQVQLATDTSVPLVGAPEVWEQSPPGGGDARGDGVVIAIIDSGIDYTNESLGQGFGEGHKVVAGHDFVNDDTDPMDDNGHGTHVAGIAAGNGRITGVAPEATLTAYKVVDRSGGGYESDVLAGLEAAVDPANPHRADVVNMSLSFAGDGTDPVAEAARAATRNGVVVVASAGNAGDSANAIGSPAVADGVISVGASASGVATPELRMTAPDDLPLQTVRAGISANPPDAPVTGEVVDVGRGRPADLEEAGDLTGKVVAVQGRAQETVELTSPLQIEFARQVEEAGAVGLVYYSASSGGPLLRGKPTGTTAEDAELQWPLASSGDTFRMDELVVVGLQELEWEQITARLVEGPVRIRISGRDMTDRMASFSSRGPSPAYALEPDLVAPGVEVVSAWPTRQWEPGVFRLSGTSMSAPHVAGAAALLRQLDPDADVDRLGARLIGSAQPLEGASPTAQGAGRLDVAAASKQILTASPTSLSLGLADTAGPQVRETRRVTLYNDGAEPVALELEAHPSADSVGQATVTPRRVQIPAGGSRSVEVRVQGRTPEQPSELSGWVEARLQGAERPALRVPYQMSVVPVIVQASPDPGPGGTTLFIGVPADLTSPPVVTVRPPRGPARAVEATHDHGTWWRASYRSDVPGRHEASVRAATELGATVTGSGFFEVLPTDPGGTGAWQSVGPNTQAGWIAETPADPDTMALHQYDKLSPWVSTDDGETWREVPSLPVADGEGTVVVDPDDARQMWYAVRGFVGGALFDPTYLGAILRSTDGGSSWSRLAAPNTPYGDLVIDPEGRVLVAVADDSLQVSRDDGATWTTYPNPVGAGVDDTAFSGADLFLSSARQVWRIPGLAAGEPDPARIVYEDTALRGMAVDETVVAVLNDDHEVDVSTDGGATWEQRYQAPQYGPWDLFLVGDDFFIPTYNGRSFVGRAHGSSWRELPHPVTGAIPMDVTTRGDDLLWAEQNIGMLLGDPESGEFRDRIGVPGMTASDVLATEGGELLASTVNGLYDTELPTGEVTPDTREWGLNGNEAWTGRGVSLIDDAPSDRSVLWSINTRTFSTFDVMRSTDGGETWEKRGSTGSGAHALAVDAHDPDSVAVAFSNLRGAGVHLTRDGGATWRKMFHQERFRALESDPDVPGRLWLGGDSGLYVSDDFGVTLRKVRSGPVTAIEVTSQRLVAAGAGIVMSTDDGRTFKDARDGDVPMEVTDLVSSPTDSRLMFAGTSQHIANGLVKNGRGVLMSHDGGRSWTNVSEGLQNLSVESLEMTADGRWLFAGTTEGGVHRLGVGR